MFVMYASREDLVIPTEQSRDLFPVAGDLKRRSACCCS